MPLIQWDDRNDIGIKEIDDQHREYIRFINQMHDAMADGKAKKIVLAVIDQVHSYGLNHFETEEKIMAEKGYPELTSHKVKHEDLRKGLLSLKKSAQGNDPFVTSEAIQFFIKWQVEHVQQDDMDFKEYLRKTGKK